VLAFLAIDRCGQKILRGEEIEYDNKVFEFDLGGKVLFAAEGLTGVRDDFFLLFNHEISRRRGVDTMYEVKLIVEDIIADLTRKYGERVKQESPIGVLMGGLERRASDVQVTEAHTRTVWQSFSATLVSIE